MGHLRTRAAQGRCATAAACLAVLLLIDCGIAATARASSGAARAGIKPPLQPPIQPGARNPQQQPLQSATPVATSLQQGQQQQQQQGQQQQPQSDQLEPPQGHNHLHTPFNAEASLQIAARQSLFDYAVQQGLRILDAAVRQVTIPPVKTSVDVPLLGGVDLEISGINISSLAVPRGTARVTIESGYYHVQASNVSVAVAFDWAWRKGPLHGSGSGEIELQGGDLDEIFLVRNQEEGVPQLVAVTSSVAFGSLHLQVHSSSVDWLYQGLLFIFGGAIKRQIEEAVDSALRTDVPSALNAALSTLPARISIGALPFDAVFTYALYTLNYVMLKGYGEVAVPPPSPGAPRARACPFPAGALPLAPADVGGEPHMFSAYIHASVLNCVLWGLYEAGALRTVARDGAVPQVRLITDLFGVLIPQLPKVYPKKGLQLDIAALEAPRVAFSSDATGGVSLVARYATNVSVLDPDGSGSLPPRLVAQLAADLQLSADLSWDATNISAVAANHSVLWQEFPVNVAGWNQILEWVVRQAGPHQTMHSVWDAYVHTPATPYLQLRDVATRAVDGWFVLSSDVEMVQLPPLPGLAVRAGAEDTAAGVGSGEGAEPRLAPQ